MGTTLKSIRTIFTQSNKQDQSDTTTAYADGKTTNNSPSSDQAFAERIHNTPFTIVGNQHRGYFIGYGHAQVSNVYKTKKETIRALEHNHWEIICNMIAYTVEHWNNSQKVKNGAT